MTGGIGRIRAEQFWTEQVRLTPLTSDPADSEEGKLWLRADLAEDDDQLATLRLDTGGSTVDIPVFDVEAEVPDDVSRQLRLVVDGQQGFAPTVEGAGSIPQLGVWSDGVRHEAIEDLVALPDSVVDNFEDADADPPGVYASGDTISDFYSGDTSAYARTTNEVIEGGKALEYTGEGDDFIASEPGDELNRYPKKGEIIAGLLRDTSTEHIPNFLIGAEVSEGGVSGYGIQIRPGSNRMRIVRFVDSDQDSILAETTDASLNFDNWYDCEVEWHDGSGSESDNEIVFTAYEIDQITLERGDIVASISANDSTFENNSGLGFRAVQDGPETLFDFVRVTGEV